MTRQTGADRTPSEPVSPEVRERAVRLAQEQQGAHETQWAAIRSIAEKIGGNAETRRLWVRQAERDTGTRAGITTDERERLTRREQENRELKRANEILRKASAFFAAAEPDRDTKYAMPSSMRIGKPIVSSRVVGRGAASRMSNTRPSNGWRGATHGAC
jgi:transposase